MTRGRLLSKALNMNDTIRVEVKRKSRNTISGTIRVKVSVKVNVDGWSERRSGGR